MKIRDLLKDKRISDLDPQTKLQIENQADLFFIESDFQRIYQIGADQFEMGKAGTRRKVKISHSPKNQLIFQYRRFASKTDQDQQLRTFTVIIVQEQ